jgi:general secretion pathway protein G
VENLAVETRLKQGYGMNELLQRGRPSLSRTRHRLVRVAGFTLIELMIVITIIFILIGIAAPRYDRAVQRAREATLKTDLQVMRQAIDNYTLDKESAPQSLEDLANPQAPYLREVPTDPMTRAKDWRIDFGDLVMTPDQTNNGIVDVHSNSSGTSSEGTPYNTW